MKIVTTELVLAAVSARNYTKDGQEKVFRSAKLLDSNGEIFEASVSQAVFELLKDVKTSTGEATLEIVSRPGKTGRPVLRMELLAFKD